MSGIKRNVEFRGWKIQDHPLPRISTTQNIKKQSNIITKSWKQTVLPGHTNAKHRIYEGKTIHRKVIYF